MRLPQDLLAGTYTKPRLFLCETDKTKICQLETTDMSGSFKFNTYSELSCSIGRTYEDMIHGEQKINPFFDKIEALRVLYLEGFGYFEIQEPEVVSDGIMEVKNITANSLEYTLSQKYLENFKINTGEVDSVEVIYAENNNIKDSYGNIIITPVTLYNPTVPSLSLLHLALEKIYGWKIGHVDASLRTMSRTFNISRGSVYDFLTQDICAKFNCFIVFDTIDNTINVYAEAPISKFIGDGETKSFHLFPAFDAIDSVTVNSYKTTRYTYQLAQEEDGDIVGVLTFEDAPPDKADIQVTDGSQKKYSTDVYVTFDNLAQEINISYSADDIKTVLTVKGADDLNIREVNMGLPYITDISYYCTVDWMGEELYKSYSAYAEKAESCQYKYLDNSKEMIELSNFITYEEQRLSLKYSIAEHVHSGTVGKYYVRGGTAPNYYYKEVSLPAEFNIDAKPYYTLSGNDLNETKVSDLFSAIKTYYASQDEKDVSKFEDLKEPFAFMETNTIDLLVSSLTDAASTEEKDAAVCAFFDEMWEQLGKTPLKALYLDPYTEVRNNNQEAGWNDLSNENYWLYHPVVLIIDTINNAISIRTKAIERYTEQRNEIQMENVDISNDLLIANNFSEKELIRLNSFLREDEYVDDNFIETDSDTIDSLMQTKQELLECGKIELDKLCKPKLSFSMTMANIYALDDFAPIVDQFQLGNLIMIELRPKKEKEKAYVRSARLLQVNINFEDFSDFSCEFGELTSLQTPSSIHADLLSTALQAGKTVASNVSYWNKGSDLATSTDLKIQQGLLDVIDGLYSSNQGVIIDKYGIKLTKIDPSTGEVSPYQAWIRNNGIYLSSDGFKNSTRTGLGEFTVDGETFYGILAEAVLSGYIESSRIVGGSIKIGEQSDGSYAFEVREDGSVIMNGGNTISGYAKEEDIADLKKKATIISDQQPDDASEGQLWLNTAIEPYTLMVFTNGKWEYFSQKDGETIYITRPDSYKKGDLWIVSETDNYNACRIVEGESHQLLEDVWNNGAVYYTKNGLEIQKISYTPYENETKGDVGNYTTGEDGLFHYNIYTSYDSSTIPDPSIMYHQGFFGSVGFNAEHFGDSITIYDANGAVICSQSDIKYYGTDESVSIKPSEDVELYLIYSNDTMYLLKKYKSYNFFCEKTTSRFVNGTLLKAVESSSTFSYDHWIDITPENTQMQNNIYQNFEFNKDSGLTIGQTDNAFYVNLNSQEMGFYDNSDPTSPNQKVVNIGNKSATIQNAVFQGSEGTQFENNVTFEQQINMHKPDTTAGFAWKIEQNGSLSLAITS